METTSILFIHGAGTPQFHQGSLGIIEYLQHKLNHSFPFFAPIMPHPDQPDMISWMDEIDSKIHGNNCSNWLLIGHSFGGSVLLKYILERSLEVNVLGLFLIAAPCWGSDQDWQFEEFRLKEELLPGLNIQKLPIYFYHSEDDQVVPIAHLHSYAALLPHAHINSMAGCGHYFVQGIPVLVRDIQSFLP